MCVQAKNVLTDEVVAVKKRMKMQLSGKQALEVRGGRGFGLLVMIMWHYMYITITWCVIYYMVCDTCILHCV